jgi:glycosyltransferase involved in cell wall biosynthesis
MPKVSIITAGYNGANFLPRAIKSAITQTFQDWEMLVIDDGSTDNTKEVVAEFQKKDNRIKYFHKENGGFPSAANYGTKIASGEYIAFLDQDDEWLLEKLKEQVRVLDQYKDVGMVSCWAYHVEEGKSVCQRVEASDRILTTDEAVREFINKRNLGFFIVPTMIMVRSSDRRQFDENLKFTHDCDFILSAMESANFYCVGRPLVNYHIHDVENKTFNSYRNDKDLGRVKEGEKIFRKHQTSFQKNKKGASIFLRNIGIVVFLSSGDKKRSWPYYAIAIKLSPFDFQNYAVPFFSMFGAGLFTTMLKFKRNKMWLKHLWSK